MLKVEEVFDFLQSPHAYRKHTLLHEGVMTDKILLIA